MCGIVGMAGKLEIRHKDAFKDFLTVCQVRGRDSTGVMSVSSAGKFDYAKAVGTPEFLLDTKAYDKVVTGGLKSVLLGHTRSKTMGDVLRKNAHPFEHGDICGVHNGTLRYDYGLEGRRDFDVDSDWLYWHVAKYGIEETIPKLDNGGAWALVWWNETDKRLNFIRNDERPLFFTHSEDRECMFWASEPWMFATLERRGIKLWDGGEKGHRIYPLPINQWYSFGLNHSGKTPQDIFNLAPVVELKGEVRGYSGNVNRGCTGVSRNTDVTTRNTGGEVVRPFRRSDLNDDIQDIAGTNKLELHRLNQESMLRAEGLIATSSTGDESSKPSPNSSDSPTDSTNSSSTSSKNNSSKSGNSKPTLSVVKGRNSSDSKGSTASCNVRSKPEKRVSLRTIHGIDYITDNATSKEFSEQQFEMHTEGKCTFCRQPIGGLEEVFQLFIKGSMLDKTQSLSFICNPCVTSPVN